MAVRKLLLTSVQTARIVRDINFMYKVNGKVYITWTCVRLHNLIFNQKLVYGQPFLELAFM